jgi:hypothetical protein
MQVAYTEPPEVPDKSPGQILNDVTNGKIPEVQTLRDELGADLVLLFNNDTTTCGLSWGYNIRSDFYFNMEHGYAVIMAGCWHGHVVAHEVRSAALFNEAGLAAAALGNCRSREVQLLNHWFPDAGCCILFLLAPDTLSLFRCACKCRMWRPAALFICALV